MTVAQQLEVVAHGLTAVLGVWLGLTVATRSGAPAARVFALLALALATWSSSIVVQRLATHAGVVGPARTLEEIAVTIAIAATAHFSLMIATDGRPSRRQRATVAAAYVLLFLFAVPTMIDPRMPIAVTPPHFSPGPIPGSLLGWTWVGLRIAVLAAAVGWLVQASRASDVGPFRRHQLRVALGTVLIGGIGASLRILPVVGDADAWIGVSFVTLALVLATYAVFSAGIFFGPVVAGRAFRTSMVSGLILFALVVMLVAVDTASRSSFGLDVPFFAALLLVVSVALYEPVTARLRVMAAGGGARALARDQLLRALGQEPLTAQPAASGVEPALARLRQALDVTGLAVVGVDGAVIAADGVTPESSSIRPVTLALDGDVLGELRVGETASGASLSPHDEELLQLSAAYVAAALRTGRREDEQAVELTRLAEDRAAVESRASDLHAALAEHRDVPRPLRVWALGALRVERDGSPLERWGGDKAGTRQAQALFAFLFDRGERGMSKDEATELIWPDVDLERADLAFHRTLGGLRATLEPGRMSKTSRAIRFVNDRYRLDAALVEWSDAQAFLDALDAARDATGQERVRRLEEARRLHRGDYLDDCPFYGDSVHVEERRELFRARFVDLATTLGEAYERQGDRMSAAAAFRDAIQAARQGWPPAEAGLARVGFATTAESP